MVDPKKMIAKMISTSAEECTACARLHWTGNLFDWAMMMMSARNCGKEKICV